MLTDKMKMATVKNCVMTVRLASLAVILTLLRKACKSFCDLIKTIPILRVYTVVKINGFVMQASFVKKVKGVAIIVNACIDMCKIDTLKSDVMTMGVFLLTLKVTNVKKMINKQNNEMDPIM